MKETTMQKPFKLLSYDTITSAQAGDRAAIEQLLEHYDAYITALAVRRKKDKLGKIVKVFDPDYKAALQAKLIEAIPFWKELI